MARACRTSGAGDFPHRLADDAGLPGGEGAEQGGFEARFEGLRQAAVNVDSGSGDGIDVRVTACW